jgi:hypothetical protein
LSGGSKGDKQQSQVTLPPEVQALATRNLKAAEKAGQVGYVPYQGPTVAALNPMQVNSMQQNANAMQAFGMGGANVAASIPKAKTYAGGVQGYDPLALYTQALGKVDPYQKAQIASFTAQAPASFKPGQAVTNAMGQPLQQTAAAAKKVAKAAAAATSSKGNSRYVNGGTYFVGGQQYRARDGRLHRITGSRKN